MARPGRKKSAWKRNPRYRGLRPWKPGQSGNPKGRPNGSRNKVGHRMSLEKLVAIVDSKRAPPAVQARAAKIYLEIIMRAAGLWEK
jgi:Family of unknown function (DUF5681)